MILFKKDIILSFNDKPIRFLAEVSFVNFKLEKTKKELNENSVEFFTVYLPNPGRLQEFLIPNRLLIAQATPKNKLPYSIEAVYYKDKIIPLNPSKGNAIALHLIFPILFPKGIIQSEVKKDNSRLDFKIELEDAIHYIEIKTCSLCEYGLALFPDAPSDRATKHLKELELLRGTMENGKPIISEVIFIILHPDAKIFSPNYHTDPIFSLELEKFAEHNLIRACSFSCTEEGILSLVNSNIPITFKGNRALKENKGLFIAGFSIEKKFYTVLFKTENLLKEQKLFKNKKSSFKELQELLSKCHNKIELSAFLLEEDLEACYNFLSPYFLINNVHTLYAQHDVNLFHQEEFLNTIFKIRHTYHD